MRRSASLSKAQLEATPNATATSVSIDAASRIDASAKTSGDGGKVIVWSDGATAFSGSILGARRRDRRQRRLRRGVRQSDPELRWHRPTSAPRTVSAARCCSIRSTRGSTPTAGVGVITVASVQAALASGDVIVTTGAVGPQAGDLTVAAAITWASGNDLGLFAHRNVNVNANITATNGGDVLLRADQTGTGTGTVIFNGGAQVLTSGKVKIGYNPTSYTDPTPASYFGGCARPAHCLHAGEYRDRFAEHQRQSRRQLYARPRYRS